MNQIIFFIRKHALLVGVLFLLSAGAVYAQATNPFACPQYPEQKVGSRGTCVQRIKWHLNNKQTPSPAFDLEGDTAPVFDAKTLQQVQKWQKDKGLNCTEGVVGPETWNSFEPGLGMTGPCVDGTIKTGGNSTGTTGNAGYSNDLTKECKDLEQSFTDFGGSVPGSLALNCYSPGQGLNKIIRLAFTFVGILAVLFIVIGGYKYMTAAGDDKKAGAGKKTIQWALIGLIATLFAYSIVAIATRFATQSTIF